MNKILIDTQDGYKQPLTLFQPAKEVKYICLLLPALGLGAKYYSKFAASLAEHNVAIAVFEQRGHGDSSLRPSRNENYGLKEPLDNDIPAAVQWLKEQYNVEQIYLLGHSLGGHLSICYSALHPVHIKGLGLIACGTPWRECFDTFKRTQLSFLGLVITLMGKLLGYYRGSLTGFGSNESYQLMCDWRTMVDHNEYRFRGVDYQAIEAGIAKYSGSVLSLSYQLDKFATEKSVVAVLEKLVSAKISRYNLSCDDVGITSDHFKWARHPEVSAQLIIDWLTGQH